MDDLRMHETDPIYTDIRFFYNKNQDQGKPHTQTIIPEYRHWAERG